MVSDPFSSIFGVTGPELFKSPELVVAHGALERFPAFMREGAMESIESLCKSYVGNLEVAQGSVADGLVLPRSVAEGRMRDLAQAA